MTTALALLCVSLSVAALLYAAAAHRAAMRAEARADHTESLASKLMIEARSNSVKAWTRTGEVYRDVNREVRAVAEAAGLEWHESNAGWRKKGK